MKNNIKVNFFLGVFEEDGNIKKISLNTDSFEKAKKSYDDFFSVRPYYVETYPNLEIFEETTTKKYQLMYKGKT